MKNFFGPNFISTALLLSVACSSEKPALPQDISIDAPEGTVDNPYPQEANIQSSDEGDYAQVEVRGYLYGEVSDLWAHFRNPDVFINHRQIDDYDVQEVSNSDYDYFYQIHLVVHDIVTVEYDHEWRHTALTGSVDDPSHVQITWEKVDGSSFIGLQVGAIDFFSVENEENVIELQIIYQLSALQEQEENARQYMEDLYANLYAVMNGQAIPDYTE